MRALLDGLIIVFLFALFGYLHTLLASLKIKTLAEKKFGDKIAFYRLAYNISSLFFFYLIYEIAPKPDYYLYDLNPPFDLLILIPQFISLAGLVWTVMYIDGKEFLGLSQISRWRKGVYDINDLDETSEFRINGPYKFSRHPVYLFTILFLLFRPQMDFFYFIAFLCISAYFYVGSIYEEKKLTKKFGEAYINYQKSVPRILPIKLTFNK